MANSDKVFELYRELAGVLKASGPDLLKLKEGNKAAGARLRKGLLHIRKTAQEARVEIQSYKNEL